MKKKIIIIIISSIFILGLGFGLTFGLIACFNNKSDNEPTEPPFEEKFTFKEFRWSDDYQSAQLVMKRNDIILRSDATVTKEIINPTCDDAGKYIYTATGDFDNITYKENKEVIIPALGHNFGSVTYVWNNDKCTATRICQNDNTHIETETVTGTYIKATDATCTSNETGKYTVTFENDAFESQESNIFEVENTKLGHNYGNPTFIWDGYNAKAVFTCQNDNTHIEEIVALVTNEITTAPTCEETGIRTYTAKVTFNEVEYTDTKNEILNVLGHNYVFSEFIWSQDGTTAQAKYVCSNNSEHIIYENTEMSSSILIPATCESKGITRYKASYVNHTDTNDVENIEALGHNYGEWNLTTTPTFDNAGLLTKICQNDNTHTEIHVLPELNNTDYEYKVETSPTCTLTGKDSYTIIVDGQTFKFEVTTNTLGHTPGVAVNENVTPATCETNGHYDSVVYCSVCGEELSRETIIIPVLGHNYGTVTYAWNNDKCTATRICQNDNNHIETETVTGTYVKVSEATCTLNETGKYTVTFENTAFLDQESAVFEVENTKLGHNYGNPTFIWDGYTAKAVFTCQNDNTHVEEIVAVITSEVTTTPTCEGTGVRTYTAKVTFNEVEYTDTKEETLNALGHDYDFNTFEWSIDGKTAKAVYVCHNDQTHIVKYDAEVSSEVTTLPTCINKGKTTYTATYHGVSDEIVLEDIDALGHTPSEAVIENTTQATCETNGHYDSVVYCSVCGEELSRETIIIPMLGHNYEFSEFIWSQDGTTAQAKYICSNNNEHIIYENAEMSSSILTPATCESKGVTRYTATYDNHTDTNDVENIEAIGHDYQFDRFEWDTSAEPYTANAILVCSRNSSHTISNAAEVNYEVVTEATYTSDGLGRYKATYFTNMDTKDVVIPQIIPEVYNIIYNLNGGTNNSDNPDTYTILDTFIIKDPSKIGYTFIGWYLDDEFNTLAETDYNESTGDIELFAKWEANKYNVNYYVMNSLYDSEEVSYDSNYSFISVSENVGNYEVIEWRYSDDLSYSFNETITYNYTESINVYGVLALLSEDDYELTYSGNNVSISNYNGTDTTLFIPEYVKKDDTYYKITTIDNNAFKNNTTLQSVVIPYGVSYIGKESFKSVSLTNIIIPSSVTSIGNDAFHGSSLENVYYDGTIEDWCNITFSDIASNPMNNTTNFYIFDENGDIEYNGKNYKLLKDIEIPSTISTIKSNTFVVLPFDNIVIPKSVTSVEEDGFIDSSTTNLYYNGDIDDWMNIEFGEGMSIPYSSQNFYLLDENGNVEYKNNKYNLITELEIPSTTSIGNNQFRGLIGLETVIISDGVLSIGECAFSGCSLTNIRIPDSVTSIGWNAFFGCSLENVYYDGTIEDWCNITFGNAISNPMYYATNFYILDENGDIEHNGKNYKLITELIIPSTVTSIGNYQFSGYKLLTNITMPNSVISIGDYAFNYCSSLENVYYDGTIEDWCNITFGYYGSNPMCYANNFYILDENGDIEHNGKNYKLLTELEIPSTVTSIGIYQFYGFNNLISATIPNSVTSIGGRAFNGCSSLESITLPFVGDKRHISTDTYQYPFGYIFGTSSYTGGTSTQQYYYGSSSTSTTYSNYYIPTTLKEVIITDCEYIQYGAFYNCSSLTNITIPNSVTSIGQRAFYNCSSLQYNEYDNALYLGNEDNPYLCLIKAKSKDITNCIVNKDCKFIDYEAFSGCSSLQYIEYDNALYLGNEENPYLYLIKAKSKNITNCIVNKDCKFIDYGAFSGCSSLTNITIPNSVTSIVQRAFYNCSSLTNIYYDGTIEDWCNITFGDYDSNPTRYSTNFYILDENGDIEYNGKNYKLLTELEIPSIVTSIGKCQFCGFNKLTNITIPNSVTSIGKDAFYNCSSLTNVYYDGTIVDWCNITFGNYYSTPMPYAKNFYILDENGDIEYNGKNYKLLTELEIPSTVTSIGNYQFYDFNNLTNITIPNSVTSIGNNAFNGCSSLTNVYYDGTMEDWCNITFNNDESNPMYYATNFYILDENGDIVYNGKNYKLLTELEIPSTVTSIDKYQFICFDKLTNITIPYGVANIGKDAFKYCTSLTNITIPNSIRTVDYYAFESCHSLENVYYEGTTDDWCNIEFNNYDSNPMYCGTNFYILDENGDIEYNGKNYKLLTELEIPSSISEIRYTCSGFNTLINLTMHSGINFIECDSFDSCDSLENVYYDGTIEDWSNITFGNSYSNPMYYATNLYILDENGDIEYNGKNYNLLTELVIPSNVNDIFEFQFIGLNSIKYLFIHNNVRDISDESFVGCDSLESIIVESTNPYFDSRNNCNAIINTSTNRLIFGCKNTIIPDTVETLGHNSFKNCSTLTSIVIPYGVKSIESRAFENCTALENITISESVTSLGNYVFYKCSSLTNITIPNSLTSLAFGMFYICKSLESIIIPNTITLISGYAFYRCSSLEEVYYQGTQEEWNLITIQNDNQYLTNATKYYYSEEEPQDSGNYWHYVDGVVTKW